MDKLLVEILGRKIDVKKIENPVLRKLLTENIQNINGGNSLSWLHKNYSEDGYYLEHNAHNETHSGYLAMNSESPDYTEYTDEVVRKRLVSSDEYNKLSPFDQYLKDHPDDKDSSGSTSREGMGYCEN